MVACDLAKVIVGVRFSYPAPELSNNRCLYNVHQYDVNLK